MVAVRYDDGPEDEGRKPGNSNSQPGAPGSARGDEGAAGRGAGQQGRRGDEEFSDGRAGQHQHRNQQRDDMAGTRSQATRRAGWVLLICALFAPALFYGAARAVRSNNNKVEDWLPAGFNETAQLKWFRDHFITDQFVVVSWEGCRLGGNPADPAAEKDDPRIEQVAAELLKLGRNVPLRTSSNSQAQPLLAANANSDAQPAQNDRDLGYFRSVTTARQVLGELTSSPSEVPYDVAVDRLRGTLIGPDGRQTCVLVTLSAKGAQNLRQAIGRGTKRGPLKLGRPPGEIFAALASCGVPAQEAHLGGPPIDNVAIDEEGERTLVRLAGLSLLLGVGLAWWSLRSVKLTTIVFVCGILSAALNLASVWATGTDMDAVLLSMPSLVYVLAMSGAVHLVNYYRDEVIEHGLAGAPMRAIAHGWRPAVLCSITTAIGLASLYASEIEPIRKFGIYSAGGVMGMLIILFTYLPAALQFWPVDYPAEREARRKKELEEGSRNTTESDLPTLVTWSDRFWNAFGSGIIGRHGVVFAGCLLVIGGAAMGLGRISTSIDLLKLFDPQARIISDYMWLEKHLGKLVPMEVVIRFPQSQQHELVAGSGEASETGTPNFLERMEFVSLAQSTMEKYLGPDGRKLIGRTMSAATFAPELPSTTASTANLARRVATNDKMLASRDGFERSGYLRTAPEDGAELWRISLRVAAFEDLDYGSFTAELSDVLNPVLAARREFNRVVSEIAMLRREGETDRPSVVLWQQPAAAPLVDAKLRLATKKDQAAQQQAAEQQKVAQQIFVDTLSELFQRKRFRVTVSSVDPDTLADDVLAKLKPYDGIVLLGGFTADQRTRISNLAAPTISVLTDMNPDDEVEREVANYDPLVSADLSAVYTGVVPIVYKAQRVLLNSLIESTIWSFATILPLMMFVCRSMAAGCVVMIPNVLPVVMIFGMMGWLRIKVDIGSMMSASIALGVAVDDTIHFLTWFRADLDRVRNTRSAVLFAYRRCAPPTLQAALISGLGLSVFAFSTFTPTQRFGWLMLTILIAGVVAELVMLPAILAGPLGRVFKPHGAPPAGPSGHVPPPQSAILDAQKRVAAVETQ